MGFHRLTTPSYFGGLLGGYDLINSPTALGTTPAPVDGPKANGPNQGTYFHAFGEPAATSNFNRSSKALAENCDFLDDLLHRDLAVTQKTNDTTAPSNITTVTLPAGTYLGPAGYTNTPEIISLLFSVRDATDRMLLDATGAEIVVSSATLSGGDAIGGGFSANSVTLNLSTTMPSGSIYRVYYGARTNAAGLGEDALLNRRLFGLLYTHLYAPYPGGGPLAHPATSISYAGGPAWTDATTNPATNVELQLDKIVSDLTGTGGAIKIGSALIPASGGPLNLAAGTIRSQLTSLAGALNSILSNHIYAVNSVTGSGYNTTAGGGGTTFHDIPSMSLALSGCAASDIIIANFSGTFFVDDDTKQGEVQWYVDDGGSVILLTEAVTTLTTAHGLVHRKWSLTKVYTAANTGTITLKAAFRSLDGGATVFMDSGFIDAVRIRI